RERKEEIPLLASYFIQTFAKQMQNRVDAIPTAVMKALTAWEWPGNVRELENFIERAVILTRGRSLEAPLTELRKVRIDEPKPEANHEDIAHIVKETIKALHGDNVIAENHGGKQLVAIVRAFTVTKGSVGGSEGMSALLC